MPMAENVIGFLPAALTFFSAPLSEAQSLIEAGSTPTSSRIFLL